MMNNKVRIYGKELNCWTYEDENGRQRARQYEIEYKEYDTKTGEIVGAGSEDFSPERYNKEVKDAFVWTWDGVKLNKGGHRWFEQRGYIKYRRSEAKQVKEYMATKYAGVALVQLRKGIM